MLSSQLDTLFSFITKSRTFLKSFLPECWEWLGVGWWVQIPGLKGEERRDVFFFFFCHDEGSCWQSLRKQEVPSLLSPLVHGSASMFLSLIPCVVSTLFVFFLPRILLCKQGKKQLLAILSGNWAQYPEYSNTWRPKPQESPLTVWPDDHTTSLWLLPVKKVLNLSAGRKDLDFELRQSHSNEALTA